jgi:hypothetical protein
MDTRKSKVMLANATVTLIEFCLLIGVFGLAIGLFIATSLRIPT